jgi:hypothetical protein
MDNGDRSAAKQRSLDNILPHRFKPRQSGNPKGQKPGTPSLVRGIAHQRWSNGSRSAFIPLKYRKVFKSSLNDPALMRLDRDLALIEARLAELLNEFKPDHEHWLAVEEAEQEVERALNAHDATGLQQGLATLRQAVKEGQTERARWQGILSLLEARRRMIESGMKQMIVTGEFLRRDEVYDIFRRFIQAARDVIGDRKKLFAIEHLLEGWWGTGPKKAVETQAQTVDEP